MKKIIFVLMITFIAVLNADAQIKFQRTIYGPASYSYIQTADSGYAVVGSYNFSFTNMDMYIAKLDANGTLRWNKTIGGGNNDVAYSVIQSSDRGFVLAGSTQSFGAGIYDIYIVKLDSNGGLQWNKTVGGTNWEEATSIKSTTDGGFVIAGYTNSFGTGGYDMFLLKFDVSGTLQWSKTIGGSTSDFAKSVIQTSDGGYALSGANYYRTLNVFIVKLNSEGALQWSRAVGDTSEDDTSDDIIQTVDGGYMMVGGTNSFGAEGGDMYIVKFDSIGTLQWTRTVGSIVGDNAHSVIQTADGGYAIAGENGYYNGMDFFIVKLNGSGVLLWSQVLGQSSDQDFANSIIRTYDMGYVVGGMGGTFGAGVYIVKFDYNWNTCRIAQYVTSISGTGGYIIPTNPMIATPTPIITSPAPSIYSPGVMQTPICFVGIQPITNEVPVSFKLYQNYPNPFNPTTKIKFDIPPSNGARGMITTLVIYDVLGREVAMLVNEQLKPGMYEVEWDGSNYPSGVYFYKLTAGDASAPLSITKKMVLIK